MSVCSQPLPPVGRALPGSGDAILTNVPPRTLADPDPGSDELGMYWGTGMRQRQTDRKRERNTVRETEKEREKLELPYDSATSLWVFIQRK